MKILHILNSNNYSGAENVVCTIMKNMRQEDECLYMSPDGNIRKKLEKLGLPFYGTDRLDASVIRRAAEEFGPDIIHAHDFTASIASSGLLGKAPLTPDKKPIPVISHLHNNRPWMRSINPRTLLYAFSFNRYAAVLAVSDSIGSEYVFSKSQGRRMVTVGNPFSVEAVRQMAGEDSKAAPGKETDLLFVGRLTEQKNLPCFIETVGLLKEEIPDIRASIVGTGEDDKLCRDLIKGAGLENNITMEGYVENPYTWMAHTRLLLMPSRYEGFGLVALEAMSLGVPVLACPVGGLAKIVTAECGALCHTAGEFSKKAAELLSHKERYEAASKAARARAEEYDNVGEYMKRLYGIYRQVEGR